MIFSDDKLLELNRMGLIPGPGETEEQFSKRVEDALSFKLETDDSLGIPTKLSQLNLQFNETNELFDFIPDWVPVYFSNYQLMPWQGGCAWFFQLVENGPIQTFFQLRKQFFTQSTYLGIYSRDELIAHESAHVGRMAFEEPKFEEILAYRTSRSFLRRWFSPIIQSAKESLYFVIILIVTFILEFLFLYYGIHDTLFLILWMKLILLGFVGYGIGRLFLRQSQLEKCMRQVELFIDKQKVNPLVYRLTDVEIILFSKSTTEEIKQYINEKSHHELRWRLIKLAYIDV